MKKILLNSLCAAAVMFGATAAMAQPADDMLPPPPPGHEFDAPRPPMDGHEMKGPHGKDMRGGPDRLAKDLGLTDEQKEQARKIHEQGREKVKPLMEEMKNIHEKMEKLRKENMAEFEKILTPEQKDKFEKIKAERKQHWEKNRMKKDADGKEFKKKKSEKKD